MKTIIKNNLFTCLSTVLVALILMLPVVFVQAKSIWPSIPPEAVLPLGGLSTQNPPLFDIGSGIVNVLVDTGNAGSSRVAPGELLPISISLRNFGGGQKVDVTITYQIINSADAVVLTTSETVAVETTASFIKVIQIPVNFVPGIYTANSSIEYLGQKVPATSSYQFTVERRILGLFKSDFMLYGGIVMVVSVLMVLLGHTLVKRREATRFTPFDYSDIPHDKRIFYEILSDTIMEMRERVGDNALLTAANIDGLKIDKETGRVIALTDHPAKIIATLVSKYENLLGKKVSFSLRREKTDKSR